MNILIVNYNTQKLTDACICSINQKMKDVNIYVFDNSNNEPFNNTHSNVTVFDNTKSQLVDFSNVLNKYENKTKYGAESDFGSLKHAMSVDKCFDLIDDNFILLDSDVLIKKDLSELYDDTCIYVGDIQINGCSKKLRLSPHVCFINIKMAKENNIRYFDENRIVGLSEEGDDYDTGSSFYFDSNKLNNREINENDYIVHYGAGSWIGLTNTKKVDADTWLNIYRPLWNDNIDIFICAHKKFTPKVRSRVYKIAWGNNIHTDITHNGLKDDFYSELYQFKYVCDNIPLKKYVGFCHYRRYFNFLDNIPDVDEIFKSYDAIVGKPLQYKLNVKEFYGKNHNIEDLYIIGGIIADKYPSYCNAWHNFINGNMLIPYNMFIMKSEHFKEHTKFIFDVMDEYLKIVGTDIKKRISNNKELYIKNVYPNNTEDYQYRIGGYICERLTNVFILTHFKKLKTYPIIVTENKYVQKKG